MDRQSAFCKAAIETDQITLCWRSDATRKRSVCTPMAMLAIYGDQFPIRLRCRRPLLIHLRCTWSDYDQIATCWVQSYKSMRHSDATIDLKRPENSLIWSNMAAKSFSYWLSLNFFFDNMTTWRTNTVVKEVSRTLYFFNSENSLL